MVPADAATAAATAAAARSSSDSRTSAATLAAGLPPAVAGGVLSQPPSSPAELPPIVALGKFDALHKGHRALAAAAAQLGGAPWLVSFSGIAQVLGWPTRLPLVAHCDRQRVMASWGQQCQGRVPQECAIPFAEVRSMSPEAFVELLARQLQVAGVVVGSNYRFGYRAAGTAELLQQLGPQYGLQIQVLGLVGSQAAAAAGGMAAGAAAHHQQHQQQQQHQHQQQQQPDGGGVAAAPGEERQQGDAQQQQQQAAAMPQTAAAGGQRHEQQQQRHQAVSSSRVRHALAAGDMADAADCLGRPYRLVASLADAASSALPDGPALRLPSAACLNQPPRPGRYQVRAGVVAADTLQQLLPGRQAVLGVDEAGLTLHGAAHLVPLPQHAQHITLDFL